jgi:hypothetical protein
MYVCISTDYYLMDLIKIFFKLKKNPKIQIQTYLVIIHFLNTTKNFYKFKNCIQNSKNRILIIIQIQNTNQYALM